MLPAIVWDEDDAESSFAPSVIGTIRKRVTPKPQPRPSSHVVATTHWMVAGIPTDYALRKPGSDVREVALVFVFTPPDAAPAQELVRRRAYFDVRTGDEWHVFFPGYFRYGSMSDPDEVHLDELWGFSPQAFDSFRRRLERDTGFRWRYSGASDLVIIRAWVDSAGQVTVDWESTLHGPLTDAATGHRSLTLSEAIERISAGLEDADDDPTYRVPEVVETPNGDVQESTAGTIARGAVAGVMSAIGARWLGLN